MAKVSLEAEESEYQEECNSRNAKHPLTTLCRQKMQSESTYTARAYPGEQSTTPALGYLGQSLVHCSTYSRKLNESPQLHGKSTQDSPPA